MLDLLAKRPAAKLLLEQVLTGIPGNRSAARICDRARGWPVILPT